MSVLLFTIAAMAVSAGLASLITYHRLSAPAEAPSGKTEAPPGPVFLFSGADLIDMTPDAQHLIAPFTDLPDREALLQALMPQFPALASGLDSPDRGKRRIAHRQHDDVWIDLDWPGGQARLAIHGRLHDPTAADLPSAELDLLRDVTRLAPQLMWQTQADGTVTWANQAYLDFWDRLHPQDPVPLAQKTIFAGLAPHPDAPSLRRMAVPLPDQAAEHWCDVTSVTHGKAMLHFASDANGAVQADQERRNFVQTLGKTFAELSIGLAIFDKRRQLATFNPALLDMTRLAFDFLSTRPSIDAVLDRLRETRILPEPKDYASWRDQFSAVESAAKNGTYSEVWNLPDGQAFRVTGRPHPDGAFAFLFEDITADLSLTRRFRADIETSQAVLDALPDAVAVFSAAGTLVVYNRAYMLLWGLQADSGLEHRSLAGELALWQSRCHDPGAWADLDDVLQRQGPRIQQSGDALLAVGRLVRCHAGPLAGGMTMMRFTLGPAGLPALRKITQVDPAIRALGR